MEEITRYELPDVEAINKEVQTKYPGMRLFSVRSPYAGHFVIRQQTLADVRDASKKLKDFLKKKLDEVGGAQAFEAMNEDEQTQIQQEINASYADYSNEIVLTQCVVYPYDFAQQLKDGVVPAGIVPFLLEKIMSISCWGEVDIEEV